MTNQSEATNPSPKTRAFSATWLWHVFSLHLRNLINPLLPLLGFSPEQIRGNIRQAQPLETLGACLTNILDSLTSTSSPQCSMPSHMWWLTGSHVFHRWTCASYARVSYTQKFLGAIFHIFPITIKWLILWSGLHHCHSVRKKEKNPTWKPNQWQILLTVDINHGSVKLLRLFFVTITVKYPHC